MRQLIVGDLGKRFGRRVLFRRLGFTLEEGHALAVTGANGTGKSTLMRILAGVMRPSKGTVALHLRGSVVAAEEHPLSVGLVAPYLNVYDGFTARENLQFLARARCLSDTDARITEVLNLVSLNARADDRVMTYSSGMKQRVRFAAALLTAPPLLLLDEPTSNLDTRGLAMVNTVIDHQLTTGGLLVVATNTPDEAAQCDHIIRVEDYR